MRTTAVTTTAATTTVEATTSEAAFASSRPEPGAAAAHLAELFDAHSRSVLGLCRALLRDPDDAEDAAQQAFLSAYRSLLMGTVPRDPAAWLVTIARNECRTRSRQRMREPLAEQAAAAAAAADVHAEAVRSADVEALRQAIGNLPRKQRAAFLLREVSGLSYRELSLALGVSGPAAEALLVRARQKLRVALAPAKAALVLPLGLRDLVLRLFSGGETQFPVAAKIATVSAGVVVMAAGTTSITSDLHASRQAAAHARPAKVHATPKPRPVVVKPVVSEPQAAAPAAAALALSSQPTHEQEHEAVAKPEHESEHNASGDQAEHQSHDSTNDSADSLDQTETNPSSDGGGDGGSSDDGSSDSGSGGGTGTGSGDSGGGTGSD